MPSGKYQRSKGELERLRKMNSEKEGKTYEEIYGKEKAKLIKSKKSNLKHPRWKGGEFKLNGYIYVLKPKHPFSNNNGYIAQHRLIMEEKIGRYLKPKEIIHHINGIKTDNRIENLELTNKSKHFFQHIDTIHKINQEDRKKGAELRIRKPNSEGRFFCHLCSKWKLKTEFPKQKRNLLGVGSYCKKCNNAHFNHKKDKSKYPELRKYILGK